MSHASHRSSSYFLLAVLCAAALAGCSSGAGFGSPPPYPNAPQPQGTVQSGGGGANEAPGATPTPNTPLSVDSASARDAYDASAADPEKAPRLVEVTFALASTLASPMPIPNVSIAADKNPAVNIPLSLSAQPNQDTVETMVAVAPPKDPTVTKSLNLIFGDGKKLVLAEDSVDFPEPDDPTMTALDKSEPAGGVSIDDVAITGLIAPGSGLHYDVTFSITNRTKKDASIVSFTVTPPAEPPAKKGDQPIAYPSKFTLAIVVPARNQMAPISVVIPYPGKAKALLSGSYAITASDKTGAQLAQGSGPLL